MWWFGVSIAELGTLTAGPFALQTVGGRGVLGALTGVRRASGEAARPEPSVLRLLQVISLARWTAANASRIMAARANYDNRSPEALEASATRSSATRLVEPIR